MDNNINRGQLKRWNDDKGFGFIKPDTDSRDVFLHISAIKGMSRRPKDGDTIFYNVQSEKDGKVRAYNARIDGVSSVQTHPELQGINHKTSNNNSSWFLSTIFLVALSFLIYIFIFMRSDPKDIYSCSGKTHCSEMSSCAEAKFYLKNCPNTKLDGDRDGLPCERQLCNW